MRKSIKRNYACSEQFGQRHYIVYSFHAQIKKTPPGGFTYIMMNDTKILHLILLKQTL